MLRIEDEQRRREEIDPNTSVVGLQIVESNRIEKDTVFKMSVALAILRILRALYECV